MGQIGRNQPCHCGSGNKFKHCCLGKKSIASRSGAGVRSKSKGVVLPSLIILAGGVGAFFAFGSKGLGAAAAVLVGSILVAVAVTVFRDPPPPKSGGSDAAAINFGS